MPRARKSTKADEANATAILDAVKGLKPEDVVNQVGELQMKLQGTLAGLSAAIAGKVEQMQKVDEAILLKNHELKDLHDIDAVATTIENMVQQQQEHQEGWEKQTEAQRSVWKEEQNERMKRWQREQEEREYDLQQLLKKKRDDIEIQVSQAKRSEVIRQEDLDRSWEEREAELADKEKVVETLQAKVDSIDDLVKQEVGKAEGMVSSKLKRNYEHQIELMQKDAVSDTRLQQAEIESLKHSIGDLRKENLTLQSQLTSARTDAKEVTEKALESASGRQVTQALQKVVDSANVPGSKGK